jgi:hypothetical protein
MIVRCMLYLRRRRRRRMAAVVIAIPEATDTLAKAMKASMSRSRDYTELQKR